MKLFEQRLQEFYTNLLEAHPSIPQDGGPVVPPPPADTAPAAVPAAPPPAAPEPPKPLTSEGKRFLVELALKALAVNPDSISPADKAIFETQVTVENADEVANRIAQITEGL